MSHHRNSGYQYAKISSKTVLVSYSTNRDTPYICDDNHQKYRYFQRTYNIYKKPNKNT